MIDPFLVRPTAPDQGADAVIREGTKEAIRRSLDLIDRTPTTLQGMITDRAKPTKP